MSYSTHANGRSAAVQPMERPEKGYDKKYYTVFLFLRAKLLSQESMQGRAQDRREQEAGGHSTSLDQAIDISAVGQVRGVRSKIVLLDNSNQP